MVLSKIIHKFLASRYRDLREEKRYAYQFNIKESIRHEQSVFPQEIRAGFMKELVLEPSIRLMGLF